MGNCQPLMNAKPGQISYLVPMRPNLWKVFVESVRSSANASILSLEKIEDIISDLSLDTAKGSLKSCFNCILSKGNSDRLFSNSWRKRRRSSQLSNISDIHIHSPWWFISQSTWSVHATGGQRRIGSCVCKPIPLCAINNESSACYLQWSVPASSSHFWYRRLHHVQYPNR